MLDVNKSYWVYMLRCSDESFYVGVTSRIELRVAEHQLGLDPSCYTFSRRPLRLVYHEEFGEVLQAIAAEKKLKGWSYRKKRALLEGDWLAFALLLERRGRLVSANARSMFLMAAIVAALRQAQGDTTESFGASRTSERYGRCCVCALGGRTPAEAASLLLADDRVRDRW